MIYYSDDHEYIKIEGNIGTVGVSDYAQKQLGDVVYVELPPVGKAVKKGDEAGVVESVKVASEIYSPVTGEVVEVNKDLAENPALVNKDPQGKAWFFKVKIANDTELKNLKTEAQYKDFIDGLA